MLDTTTTQRANDSVYLQQLARRNAYELYIQPDPVAGLDIGHFHPPFSLVPPQGVLSIDFGSQTNLTDFSVSNDMLKPTGVVAVSSEPRTRAPIPALAPVAIEPPMGLEPTLIRIIPPPIERPAGTDAASPAEVQAQAFARANETSRAVRANGTVDGLKYKRPLFAGLPVLVRGAADERPVRHERHASHLARRLRSSSRHGETPVPPGRVFNVRWPRCRERWNHVRD